MKYYDILVHSRGEAIILERGFEKYSVLGELNQWTALANQRVGAGGEVLPSARSTETEINLISNVRVA